MSTKSKRNIRTYKLDNDKLERVKSEYKNGNRATRRAAAVKLRKHKRAVEALSA